MTDRSILPFPSGRADTPARGAPDEHPSGADAAVSEAGPSDAALVARVAAGDAAALGLLYDRYGAGAHAFARALVGGSADEADDVTAAAFARLWRTAARYDAERGSVAAWVTMVTRARALEHVRARGRQRAEGRAVEAGQGLVAGGAGAASLGVPAGGGVEPPDAALQLAFFGGLSRADVAAALGEPLGTVTARIRAGLIRLREALGPFAAGSGA